MFTGSVRLYDLAQTSPVTEPDPTALITGSRSQHQNQRRLAWGPPHLPSAHNVQVEMVDLLSTFSVAVDNKPVARQPCIGGNLVSGQNQMGDEALMIFCQVRNGGDVCFGDDQNVRRCLGTDVIERHDLVVLIGDVRPNFTADNFAENAVVAHVYASSQPLRKRLLWAVMRGLSTVSALRVTPTH